MGDSVGVTVAYGFYIGYNDGYGNDEVDHESLVEIEAELDKLNVRHIYAGYHSIDCGSQFLVVAESIVESWRHEGDFVAIPELLVKVGWADRLQKAAELTDYKYEEPKYYALGTYG